MRATGYLIAFFRSGLVVSVTAKALHQHQATRATIGVMRGYFVAA